MTAAFLLGAWLFVAPHDHAVLDDRVTFDQAYQEPPSEYVLPDVVSGYDPSFGLQAGGFVTSSPIDGASLFVLLYGPLFCEVLELRHVHQDRVHGKLKLLDAQCSQPLVKRSWSFYGVRQ